MDYTKNKDLPKIARDSGLRLKILNEGDLDWRLIGCLDIDKIMRDENFEKIASLIPHLSEVPLGKILNNSILDSGVAKYFILSQLSLQYLLFCKNFLENELNSLHVSFDENQKEYSKLKKFYNENNEELLYLHRKIERMEAVSEIVYPCSYCNKNFTSNDMLNIHMQKNHKNINTSVTNDKNLINTIKLELEIKQLKERLNSTESNLKIRPTFESRNQQTDYQTHTSKGIQCEIEKKNIGIQNNLEDLKEKADVEIKTGDIKEILHDLREKVLMPNNSKQIESFRYDEQILEIKSQLAQLIALADTNNTKQENTNSIPDIKKIEDFWFEHIQNLTKENTSRICIEIDKKLHQVMQKLDREHKEKISATEGLDEEIGEKNKTFDDQIIHNKSRKKFRSRISQRNRKAYSNIFSDSESSENLGSKTCSNLDEKIVKHSEEIQNLEKTKPTSYNKNKIKDDININALMLFESRLTETNISRKQKKISERNAQSIHSMLAEKRCRIKKRFPNFFIMRNKIKQDIDQILLEKYKSKSLSKIKAATNYIAEKNIENGKTYSETSAQHLNITKQKMNLTDRKPNENFKNRLNKLLESPIRKPRTFEVTAEIANLENYNDDNTKDVILKKPIPIPRKKVLFDTDNISKTKEMITNDFEYNKHSTTSISSG